MESMVPNIFFLHYIGGLRVLKRPVFSPYDTQWVPMLFKDLDGNLKVVKLMYLILACGIGSEGNSLKFSCCTEIIEEVLHLKLRAFCNKFCYHTTFMIKPSDSKL
jgi:hypothetical protein